MPTAVQPWKEIESDPEYVALPEMDRGKVFEWWKGQVRNAAKEEGSPDEEIESELNAFTAQLGTRNATGAALTASEVMTAPLKMDWGTPTRGQEDEQALATLELEREKLIRGEGEMHPFQRETRLRQIEEARKPLRLKLGFDQAEVPRQPTEQEQFAEFQRQRGETPGMLATAMDQFSAGVMNQGAQVMRAVSPSFGRPMEDAANALTREAAVESQAAAINEGAGGAVGRGLGAAGSLIVGTPAGKLGAGVAALRAAADAESSTLGAGGSRSEAQRAAEHTFPAMGAFMLAGGAAAKGAGALMGSKAAPLTQAAVGTGAAMASNVAVSASLAALEGGEYGLQNFTQDALFAILHGVGNYRNASAGLRQRAADELAVRGGVEADPDTGIVRTPAGPVKDGRIIAESSPDAIAAQAMKGLDAVKPTELAVVEPTVEQAAQIEPGKGQVEAQNVPTTEATAVPGEIPPAENRATTEESKSALPRLRPMERQGDILSTQDEPEAFRLSGEEGVDYIARQRAAEQREQDLAEQEAKTGQLFTADQMNEQARIEAEKEALSELRSQEDETGNELLDTIQRMGGLPSVGKEPILKGEIKRIWETPRGKQWQMKLVRKSQTMGYDQFNEALKQYGFQFETPAQMIEAVERAVNGGRVIAFEQTRNLGPGAANIEEPISSGPGATSTKNAVMEAERAARRADPIIKEARQSNPETLERAEQAVDSDPQSGAKIVERLISSTDRTISVEEEAVLLVDKVRLRNARAMEEERIADPNASPEERAVAQEQWGKLEEQINRMDQATHASGAIWGRLGQFRQRLLRSDYTFEAMERRARVAKQGPLSPDESAKIKEQADRIAELESKLDAVTKSKDEEFAGVSVDEAIRQIESEAKKDPSFTPEVRSLADRIIASLDATADAALARLRGKFGRTSAGVDPTILSDLVIYGSSKIAKGFVKFAQWSTAMVREFGEDVKPYLPDAWKGANDRLDAAVERVPGKNKEKVKAAVRKTDTAGKLDEITAGMKESATEGTPLREMRRDVQRLAENFVRSGIKQREPLIDAVHDVLKTVDPNVSRRETMDMISGYGDFKPLNQDQIKAELRDLKGQMQQVGKLEDITARKPLQKSGVEQRTASNEERRLIQQVNEAKRRFGVVVTDPARQLKSALDARKTYVRNRLSDLRSEIANRQRVVKERSLPPTDPELETLRSELDAVKSEHEQVFGKRELTDEHRLRLAISAAERTEAQWTKRLADAQRGIFPSGREPSKVPKSAQLDAIKARVEAAKTQVQELQDIADPNKALRSRLAARTAELQDRLARGDFSTRKRREYDVSKDPEAVRLLAEKQKVQDQFNAARERDKLRNRTILQKIWGGVKETLNLPRNLLSSWDVSAVLRQGGFIGFGNPLRSIRATGTMLKALVSERAAANTDAQIRNRPNAPLYEKSKLYLPKLDDPRLTAQEEQIMSRIANKIPGLRASNRAFLTFLNKLRADSFDAMVETLPSSKRPHSITTPTGKASQAELDAIANYINIATGRGDLGKAALAAESLATVFFSPRLLASRFQLIGSALSGFRYGGGSARTRKAIAIEYAKTLLGLSVVIGLGKLAGAKLEEDPEDSDFMKMQFGNTRADPMMGLAQVTRFITKEGMAMKRFLKKEKPKWGEGGARIAGTFLRTKLTPVLGTLLDISEQENVVGEKVTPQSAATQLVIPLSFRDIFDVMKEHGMAEGTIFELLSLFGMSVNNYQEKRR